MEGLSKFFWKHKWFSLSLIMAIYLSYRCLFFEKGLYGVDTSFLAILFWLFSGTFYIETKKKELSFRLNLKEYAIFLIPFSLSILLFFFGIKYFNYESSFLYVIPFIIAMLFILGFYTWIGLAIYFYLSIPEIIIDIILRSYMRIFKHKLYKGKAFKEIKFFANYSKKGKIYDYILFFLTLSSVYFPIQIYFSHIGVIDKFLLIETVKIEGYFWFFIFVAPVIFSFYKLKLSYNGVSVMGIGLKGIIGIISFFGGGISLLLLDKLLCILSEPEFIGEYFLYPLIAHLLMISGVSYGFLYVSDFSTNRILKSPHFFNK